MRRVVLRTIDRGNWRRALDVRLSEDQLPFAADHQPVALVIMAKSFVRAGGWEWEPLAIEVDDGELAGVLGLAHDDDVSYIFNLAVDTHHQRAGVATAAISAVVDRVRSRGGRRVSLTVHPDNTAAQALYRRCGFAPTGAVDGGQPVWEFRLTPFSPG